MSLRLLTGEGKLIDSGAARQWIEQHVPVGAADTCEDTPFWLDILEPDPAAIDWLATHFCFHPLTIEDLRSPNERGKLEIYDSYLFLIAHCITIGAARPGSAAAQPADRPGHDPVGQGAGARTVTALARLGKHVTPAPPIQEIVSAELQAYLGHGYLITVHDADMAPVEKVWTRLDDPSVGSTPFAHGVDYLLYRVLDNTVDTYFATLEMIANQLDALEDEVVDRPDRGLLEDVFTVKRNLVAMRRQATPMREATNALSSRDNPFIRDQNEVYFRDVHNLLVAVYELADAERDSTSGVLDVYLSSVNNNLSVIMKRMTIIATIFMPLSFIVGFGGMNFTRFIPYDSSVAFWLLIAALVITPVVMYLWFYQRRWL